MTRDVVIPASDVINMRAALEITLRRLDRKDVPDTYMRLGMLFVECVKASHDL